MKIAHILHPEGKLIPMEEAGNRQITLNCIRPDGVLACGAWYVCRECGHMAKGRRTRKGRVHYLKNGSRCHGAFVVRYFDRNPLR